jgi:hypothetical protein
MKTSLAAILCILFSFNAFACKGTGKDCTTGEQCCSGKCQPDGNEYKCK